MEAQQGSVLKAELHLKTRRGRGGSGLVTALLEVETEDDSNLVAGLPIQARARARAGWRKLDLSSAIRSAEAGGSDWKIHLKFQEETNHGATSEVKLLKPRSVIRFSEKPFLVIFYDNQEGQEAEEDSDLSEYNTVRRRKRSLNVSPDMRNFYGHDGMKQIETEIITMDQITATAGHRERTEKHKKDDIDDIDSEDELILDYEADDLSEAEANRHRFDIEEKQDLIPYPKWWSAKKRNRKRNHHKRFKKTSSLPVIPTNHI